MWTTAFCETRASSSFALRFRGDPGRRGDFHDSAAECGAGSIHGRWRGARGADLCARKRQNGGGPGGLCLPRTRRIGAQRGANFSMDRLWPEAISVYMQGLPTPGSLTDPEGKKDGWQMRSRRSRRPGSEILRCRARPLGAGLPGGCERIYATGHSNGGAFCYLLWAGRGAEFAAFAPCAGFARAGLEMFKPKPVMHIAGTHDPIVLFAWQRMTMNSVRKIKNAPGGTPWAEDCTLYPSKVGAPLIEFIHQGGHIVPGEAPPLIVKFFKEHPLP